MDDLDVRIIDTLQDGITVCERPFAAAGRRLGIGESELIERVEALLRVEALSRFGPMFDAERMGGAFHLCAMQVPAGDLDQVAERINLHPEVAHNYERDHALNVWFVIGSDDEAAVHGVIERIELETGYQVIDMPKLTEYYVGLRLPLTVHDQEEVSR